jgi:hypothetical protein
MFCASPFLPEELQAAMLADSKINVNNFFPVIFRFFLFPLFYMPNNQ